MVTPGMLQNPSLRTWLGDVMPAWTLLDRDSFFALRSPPSPRGGPIQLATDMSPQEIGQSAIARNALILLHAAANAPGLQLTATGNLSRRVVAEMFDLFIWPGLDKAEMLHLHKVLNEPDFMALFLIHHIVETGRLVKRRKDRLRITPSGRLALESPGRDALQALLFHVAFWIVDLSYLGRGLLHGWPQRDIGIVLCSLSICANEWQSRERLTRVCTIPIPAVIGSHWDAGTHATEAIVLRPLTFFGLLEHRSEDIPGQRFAGRHFYRKTPLFDRFLSFDVALEEARDPRH